MTANQKEKLNKTKFDLFWQKAKMHMRAIKVI